MFMYGEEIPSLERLCHSIQLQHAGVSLKLSVRYQRTDEGKSFDLCVKRI